MLKRSKHDFRFLSVLLAILVLPGVSVAGHVTIQQNGETIDWQVASVTFPVSKLLLKLTGPDQPDTTTLPAGCIAKPFACSLEFPYGSNPFLSTQGFVAGTYNWEVELVPAVGDASVCGTQPSVRDSDGGNQGLEGSTTQTAGELYIECLRDQGVLPPADEVLTEAGSFVIAATVGLVVPPVDPPIPGQPDNVAPVAKCKNIILEGDAATCTITADINDGSFDPDGTLATIVQNPTGPFGLGTTSATLTVTDNLGASNSCSANVTVTDTTAPTLQCQTSTITPRDAPVTFTATATDSCSTPVMEVVSYACYRFNKEGKRIDTIDSCELSTSGGSVTIEETSGVSSFIEWKVQATDSVGNKSNEVCTVEVIRPGKRHDKHDD